MEHSLGKVGAAGQLFLNYSYLVISLEFAEYYSSFPEVHSCCRIHLVGSWGCLSVVYMNYLMGKDLVLLFGCSFLGYSLLFFGLPGG